MSIVFASICPHPPILLPTVGKIKDRKEVSKTLDSLNILNKRFKEMDPDGIIISSPHQDWGFNVPLFFLALNFKKEIKKYLTDSENPEFYFQQGKEVYSKLDKNKKYAVIASGDLSHCLKPDGPYGFNPQGQKFDENLAICLKNKNIDKILELDREFPEAQECGLRSFCFLLGMLEASKTSWQAEILSYQGPFGVGYLVVRFKL